MEYIIIYCTVPNQKEGKEIAKFLVAKKLVACANIIEKVESIYTWDSQVCDEKESMMIIKTKKDLFHQVNSVIQKLHSYEVPEVIAIPIIMGDDKYLNWIDMETGVSAI